MLYIINCDTNEAVNEYETRGEAMKDLKYFYAFAHAPVPKRKTKFAITDSIPKRKPEEWEDSYDESISKCD